MKKDQKPDNIISFQGEPGAYSDLACRTVFPGFETMACHSFEDALAAVEEGHARYAMIPIENSVAGRVAAIHQLIPHSCLYIVGEHFQRINHHLLGLSGAALSDLKTVHSHEQALGQCRKTLRGLGLSPVAFSDTAGAAKMVARTGDPTIGAIASSLAGEIYGLDSLRENIEDATHNTTRFVIFAQAPLTDLPTDQTIVTSFIFQVRNVPAALYKVMGGFATNGLNMTKLESYQIDGAFVATFFYADIEGHPDDPAVRRAFEELTFFTHDYRMLGSYPAAPGRKCPDFTGLEEKEEL